MAFDYVHHTNYDNSSSTTIVLTKPTGTTTNDLLYALIKRGDNVDPTGVPSGWTLIAEDQLSTGPKHWLYRLVAGASEGADYTWTWAGTARSGGTMICYRDGFNTADPEDAISNTSYETSDTNVRAAAMTVAVANSPLIFFGCLHDAADTVTFGVPNNPASGITWTERVDTHDQTNSRFGRIIADGIWTGSGSTGDMDSTMSHTKTLKHAFAISLNPSSADLSAALSGSAGTGGSGTAAPGIEIGL